MRTQFVLIPLAALVVGCATGNPKSAPSSGSASANPPAVYQRPAAKSVMTFGAKCGVDVPSPIVTVAPEDQKNVTPPTYEPPSNTTYLALRDTL